jgi:hypothetical protein
VTAWGWGGERIDHKRGRGNYWVMGRYLDYNGDFTCVFIDQNSLKYAV